MSEPDAEAFRDRVRKFMQIPTAERVALLQVVFGDCADIAFERDAPADELREALKEVRGHVLDVIQHRRLTGIDRGDDLQLLVIADLVTSAWAGGRAAEFASDPEAVAAWEVKLARVARAAGIVVSFGYLAAVATSLHGLLADELVRRVTVHGGEAADEAPGRLWERIKGKTPRPPRLTPEQIRHGKRLHTHIGQVANDARREAALERQQRAQAKPADEAPRAEEHAAAPPPVSDPAAAVEREEEAAQVRRILASLPDPEREALEAFAELGSLREVGRVLGIDHKHAGRLVESARSKFMFRMA